MVREPGGSGWFRVNMMVVSGTVWFDDEATIELPMINHRSILRASIGSNGQPDEFLHRRTTNGRPRPAGVSFCSVLSRGPGSLPGCGGGGSGSVQPVNQQAVGGQTSREDRPHLQVVPAFDGGVCCSLQVTGRRKRRTLPRWPEGACPPCSDNITALNNHMPDIVITHKNEWINERNW